MKVRVEAEVFVLLPRLPNFLNLASSGQPIDVASLSDEACDTLGAAWTAALKLHVKQRQREIAVDVSLPAHARTHDSVPKPI